MKKLVKFDAVAGHILAPQSVEIKKRENAFAIFAKTDMSLQIWLKHAKKYNKIDSKAAFFVSCEPSGRISGVDFSIAHNRTAFIHRHRAYEKSFVLNNPR